MFQFTLPHGERPRDGHGIGLLLEVSIHAPAWGATEDGLKAARDVLVSIHAPAWGATAPPKRPPLAPLSFNSRSRMGSDPARPPPQNRPMHVSIHAPAWGATGNRAQRESR